MIYRLATKEDIPQIHSLCSKHGVAKPTFGVCFVADNKGEIVAFVNGGTVNFIDSIVSDNSVAGLALFSHLEGALMAGNQTAILAGVLNPDAGELLKRFGYESLDSKFFLRKR